MTLPALPAFGIAQRPNRYGDAFFKYSQRSKHYLPFYEDAGNGLALVLVHFCITGQSQQ